MSRAVPLGDHSQDQTAEGWATSLGRRRLDHVELLIVAPLALVSPPSIVPWLAQIPFVRSTPRDGQTGSSRSLPLFPRSWPCHRGRPLTPPVMDTPADV